MRAERFVLTDRVWDIIEPLLPGTFRSRGVTAKDNRLFFEAVLWKVRVGAPWRDLPPGFGEWNSIFRRWTQAGVFDRIFEAVSGDADFEYKSARLTMSSSHLISIMFSGWGELAAVNVFRHSLPILCMPVGPRRMAVLRPFCFRNARAR